MLQQNTTSYHSTYEMSCYLTETLMGKIILVGINWHTDILTNTWRFACMFVVLCKLWVYVFHSFEVAQSSVKIHKPKHLGDTGYVKRLFNLNRLLYLGKFNKIVTRITASYINVRLNLSVLYVSLFYLKLPAGFIDARVITVLVVKNKPVPRSAFLILS